MFFERTWNTFELMPVYGSLWKISTTFQLKFNKFPTNSHIFPDEIPKLVTKEREGFFGEIIEVYCL